MRTFVSYGSVVFGVVLVLFSASVVVFAGPPSASTACSASGIVDTTNPHQYTVACGGHCPLTHPTCFEHVYVIDDIEYRRCKCKNAQDQYIEHYLNADSTPSMCKGARVDDKVWIFCSNNLCTSPDNCLPTPTVYVYCACEGP